MFRAGLGKKAAVAALIFLTIWGLMGCQEKDEIGDLAVILGAALQLQDDGQLKVSVEVAHKESIDGQEEGLVFTVEAPDWQSVENKLSRELNKTLYWGHMVLLVLGEGFSAEQVYDYMEMFYRDPRLAPVIYTARCNMDSEDLLSATFGESPYVCKGIAERLSLASSQNKDDSLTVSKYIQNMYYRGSSIGMAFLSKSGDNIRINRLVTADEFEK